MDPLPIRPETAAEVSVVPKSKYQLALERYGPEYFRRKQREWKARNPDVKRLPRDPERQRKSSREFAQRNRKVRSIQNTEYRRRIVYPARELERERLIGRPKPNACEVCTRPGRISFDHCHQTEKARGWLCGKCNTTLGMVGDDPLLLRKLAEYLEASR